MAPRVGFEPTTYRLTDRESKNRTVVDSGDYGVEFSAISRSAPHTEHIRDSLPFKLLQFMQNQSPRKRMRKRDSLSRGSELGTVGTVIEGLRPCPLVRSVLIPAAISSKTSSWLRGVGGAPTSISETSVKTCSNSPHVNWNNFSRISSLTGESQRRLMSCNSFFVSSLLASVD